MAWQHVVQACTEIACMTLRLARNMSSQLLQRLHPGYLLKQGNWHHLSIVDDGNEHACLL